MRKNMVNIQGAVARPGSYELNPPMKISELIGKAENFLGEHI